MKPAVLGIFGSSGSGKTTLIEAMLPFWVGQGRTVNVLKHSHHDVVLEPPDKDSARFRAAGAAEVLLASPYRYAIVHELRGAPEPLLQDQLARLQVADLTLVEGFKNADLPKIEVYRPVLGRPPRYPDLQGVIAVVTDTPLDCPLPQWPLNAPGVVAQNIWNYCYGESAAHG